MSNRIDTDLLLQLLDRCADCGARARIVKSYTALTLTICCTECGNCIAPQIKEYIAAIIWNQEQRRKVKAKQ